MRNKVVSVLCLLVVCGLAGLTVIGAETDKKETPRVRQKHTVVKLFHKFESKEKKDDLVQQFLDVFGEQKGVLLASVGVRYTWQLETKTVILVDDTGRTSIPSVRLQIYNKQK